MSKKDFENARREYTRRAAYHKSPGDGNVSRPWEWEPYRKMAEALTEGLERNAAWALQVAPEYEHILAAVGIYFRQWPDGHWGWGHE